MTPTNALTTDPSGAGLAQYAAVTRRPAGALKLLAPAAVHSPGQFGSSSGLAGGRRPLRSSISGGPSPLPCGEGTRQQLQLLRQLIAAGNEDEVLDLRSLMKGASGDLYLRVP